MGALADLQSQRLTFAPGSPLDRWIDSELARVVDAAVPAEAQLADAVVTLTEDTVDHTGGDFTLTITVRLADGSTEVFTTGAIVFNANAATIEGAIDTAATGTVTGWTNGDISVAGGNLQTADVTLTFDGASVTGEDQNVVFNDSMTGGTSPATRETKTTSGQSARPALGALLNYGVLVAPVGDQGAATDASTYTKGTLINRIPATMAKALLREAAAEDNNNSTYHSITRALFGDDNDRAKLVETRVAGDE